MADQTYAFNLTGDLGGLISRPVIHNQQFKIRYTNFDQVFLYEQHTVNNFGYTVLFIVSRDQQQIK
jgi:hypothetical protein